MSCGDEAWLGGIGTKPAKIRATRPARARIRPKSGLEGGGGGENGLRGLKVLQKTSPSGRNEADSTENGWIAWLRAN